MNLPKTRFLDLYFTVIKRGLLAILIWDILFSLVDQSLTNYLQDILSSPKGTGPALWIVGIFMVAINILSPVIQYCLVIGSLNKQSSLIDSIKCNFQYLSKETIYATGKYLQWSLLLIVPGLIKYLRFVFIPFIVCLDEEYKMGNVNALKKSESLSRGVMSKITLITLGGGIFLGILTSLLDEYRGLIDSPLTAIPISVGESLFEILIIIMLFLLFRRKVANEAHI